MPMPIVRRKQQPVEEVEDDEVEVELELEDEDEPAPPKKTRLALPAATASAGMPVVQVGVDLDDDDVAAEMEAALKRNSSFGYKLDHIRTHIKNRDFQQASLTTKEAILSTLIELIPLAEASLRQSNVKNGIYQFNSLINQVRELMVDLDGERDLNQMVQSILDEAVRPVFMMLAQMIIQFNNSLKRQMRAELDDKQCKAVYPLIDEQVRELGTYVQSMFNEVQRRVDRKLDAK